MRLQILRDAGQRERDPRDRERRRQRRGERREALPPGEAEREPCGHGEHADGEARARIGEQERDDRDVDPERREVPATRSDRGGRMCGQFGVRTKFGAVTDTVSPRFTPRLLARSAPRRMPSSDPSDASSASIDPLWNDAASAVTPPSRCGSMPLMLTNASSLALTRARPRMAGAAPTTPGTVRSLVASSR